ncbi:hypothetical protein PC118_g1712 [Phytophthora cactorum]|uniref:Uncharacterized protein n=1 Tax=Phytophthora cactorum TaxID=29920 RepID=A0A8T1CFC8_9STRA|nr:hypothetical protein PC111_g7156 [Phytophthora cactorum]KAG2857228.1 hypothetical protein PC113_g10898 [Phytophthora cactorum]KAG2921537.1 hypothetical protein PC115_g9491 [Phytophthora cactorum]KAG2997691.1 hypothetical protein PC118_g1712 [Phytophthora cactorum]KAG3016670.1 hypothetical protein PC119_g11282 [Phytophthora cactorum]
MVNDGARQAKKRPLPLPLAPVAPVGARVSANQKDAVRTNAPSNGYRNSSAKAHERNLAKLQLHLPREVVFFDPRRRVYHSHVDLSGWRATDASLQQLQLNDDQNDSPVKSSFHTLSFDGSAHISVRGVLLMLEATTVGGGTLRALRLPRCQLLSRGGGELLDGSSLPRSLTELDVSSCEWVDDKFLRTVARHCSVLAQVTLAHCRRVTDYGVAAFGESYAASLTSLDVGFCTKLTDTALLALLVGSSSSPAVPGGTPIPTSSVSARIRQLNIAGLPLVDGLTLLGLRGPCASRLEILNMSGCTVLRVAALQRLARVRALIRLTKLDLSRCLLVDDLVLTALGMACPQLATLLLAFCSNITDVGIRRVVVETAVVRAEQHNESRQEPTIENQEDFGEEDTGRAIGRNGESGCRQLQTLDITGCFQVTSRGISALGARCPQLRSVTLDGVRRLNSSGIRDLLHGCRKLRTIRWGGILVRNSQDEAAVPGACAAFFSVPHLSDSTIAALTSSALKTLHIGTTQCDTDALASTLLSRTSSSFVISLTDLDVTALATDALCEALGNCCANLRNLRLSRSRYFSATSFLAVLRGCPRLRVLELESCEQICDEILIAVSKAPCCPHLETLILANDWQLTDTGVASLLRPATSLFRLDVRHCPEISLPVLQALAAARGHISEATRDGLTPRHPNVVAFLGRERKRRVAARKITRWLRCKLDARVSAKSTLERALAYFRRQKIAAARIQRWYRCKAAQRMQRRLIAEARRLRVEQCKMYWRWIQALCVLSHRMRIFVRIFIAARQRAAFEKAEQFRVLCDKAATEIQRIVRGWSGRRRAVEARHARELRIKRRAQAATDVQRVFRGHQSRKITAKVRRECDAEMQKAMKLHGTQFLAGLHIQRIIRGFLGHQYAKRCAVAAYELLQLQISRAKQIQRAYRAHIARVALRRMLFGGATAMQKVFRGFRGRREAREIVLGRGYASHPRILILMKYSIYTRDLAVVWKRKRDAGMIIASSLQRRYRGFCGRREARLILARQRQRWYLEDTGARTIQHFFRSIIILARLARFEALLCLRRRSATKIQATWRMWLSKALATARRLRNDRHRQHRAILDAIASQQQDRRLFLHRGAVHSVVSLYRASLVARGWLTPTYIKLLHRSAIRIQALVRGHFGRVEANWFRYELTRSASIVQRVWRGKLGKKMWRSLMEERQQLRRDQEEGDRAALIAQKQTAHHALEAFERETQHAVVLQRWYRTLKNRQVFREVRELRDREAHTRAESKVTEVIRNSTGSVVFQARVWRDCVDRKPELVALEEDAFVAMEKEIEQLKEACIEAHAGSTHASREFVELSKRKNEFERSRIRRKKATEAVKQRIQPFAVRAKQLTMESARELNANRQLQMELRRIRTELRWFHANLRGRLPMEPLLLNGDVESLLAGLTGESSSDDEDTNSAS